MNFPQSGVKSEKSSLILSLYCHIRLICISIFDMTRSWCRVNVMKKLIFHENINTLMIVWSLLLCGMPGHKANYFFRLLLLVIIWPVGRGFFETRGGGGWGRKILRRGEETRRASSGGRAGQWLNQRNGPWSRLTEWSHSQYKQQEQKMRLTIIWPKALAKLHADRTRSSKESERVIKSSFYSLPPFPRKTTSLFSVGLGFK